jgi:hypothetical protein
MVKTTPRATGLLIVETGVGCSLVVERWSSVLKTLSSIPSTTKKKKRKKKS